MLYTLTLLLPTGGTTTMSLSGDSPGPDTGGGIRMTVAEIQAALAIGGEGSVQVRVFDNQRGLPVISVVEEA